MPVHHFHVVFTVPAELRTLMLRNRRLLYALLFETAPNALLTLGVDEKRLGADLGVTAVLHTWARDLGFHPHLHCVVTGGGLATGGDGWVKTEPGFLFPVHVLGALFRGKFLSGLRALYDQERLDLTGTGKLLRDRTSFHRPPEFLRRFKLHVLPKGFVRIRHFGLLAPGNVNTKLVVARRLLTERCQTDPTPHAESSQQVDAKSSVPAYVVLYKELTGIDLQRCSQCGSQSTSIVALQSKARAPPDIPSRNLRAGATLSHCDRCATDGQSVAETLSLRAPYPAGRSAMTSPQPVRSDPLSPIDRSDDAFRLVQLDVWMTAQSHIRSGYPPAVGTHPNAY